MFTQAGRAADAAVGLISWTQAIAQTDAALAISMRDVRPIVPIASRLASAPKSKWVTETKAIETAEGCLSLAVILDLFSRMVLGWSMAATEDGQLVELALRMAVVKRHPPAGPLQHSDRGSECTSDRYLALLASLGIEVSRGDMEPSRSLL